jgi:hypothetical protein
VTKVKVKFRKHCSKHEFARPHRFSRGLFETDRGPFVAHSHISARCCCAESCRTDRFRSAATRVVDSPQSSQAHGQDRFADMGVQAVNAVTNASHPRTCSRLKYAPTRASKQLPAVQAVAQSPKTSFPARTATSNAPTMQVARPWWRSKPSSIYSAKIGSSPKSSP